MIKFLRNLPIYRKLLCILFFSGAFSLLIASVLLMALEIRAFERSIQDELAVFAKIIGNRSSAALVYGDKKLAEENLVVLHNLPAIRTSCLYDAQGAVFAELHKNKDAHWDCPSAIEAVHTHLESTQISRS